MDDDDDDDEDDNEHQLIETAKLELERGGRSDSESSRPHTPLPPNSDEDSPINFIEGLKNKVAHIRGHKPEEVDEGMLQCHSYSVL
jgi:hypothetical protein